MYKKMLLALTVIGLFFSCPKTFGLLTFELSADKSEVVSGDTISFAVTLDEKEELVNLTYFVYDQYGVEIKKEKIQSPNFEYQFNGAGDYRVKALLESKKDYGEKQIDIAVSSPMQVVDWSLDTDHNLKNFFAGESYVVKLDSLFAIPSISSIDVRFINKDRGETIYLKKDIDSTITYKSAKSDKGNYEIVLVLKDASGNMGVVRDNFVMMDADNPIFITINASKDAVAYANKIYVSGKVEAQEDIVSVKLLRRAYYGREEGIYPLSEPKVEGGVEYTKVGADIPCIEETYIANEDGSPLIFDEATETWEFKDPMNYYAADGTVEEEGHIWTYAKFDREAWKFIKRKKFFDFKKVMEVEYQLLVETTESGGVPTTSAIEKGFPFLGKSAMASLCLWAKETALNRLWHMQVPKYCWKNSMAWLLKTQSFEGAISGKIFYTVSGTTGSGQIQNYSDFPGFESGVNSPMIVAVKIATNVRQEHKVNFFCKFPLYGKVDCDLNIGVRDYILQWGMWTFDTPEGWIKLSRADFEPLELNFDEMKEILPNWNKDTWALSPGYGYDYKDMNGGTIDNFTLHTWTRINFKYPPDPCNLQGGTNVWYEKNEEDWSMYYEVEE